MKIPFLLLILVASTQAVQYIVETMTAEAPDAGTNGWISITLVGSKGETDAHILDKGWYDDFEPGLITSYTVNDGANIGKLKCVRFSTPDHDAWLPRYAKVTPSGDRDHYFHNTQNVWVSSGNDGNSVPSLKLCEQGTETYYITTRTSTEWDSESDSIYVRMKINGQKGSTETGVLNNKNYNDRMKGEDDTYTIPGMKFVGKIKCIELTVEGSDAWKFDFIEIHCDKYRAEYTFMNDDNVWLSANANEGKNYLKICDHH